MSISTSLAVTLLLAVGVVLAASFVVVVIDVIFVSVESKVASLVVFSVVEPIVVMRAEISGFPVMASLIPDVCVVGS